ncbi:MAG: tetratricopeptide repeat protein [Acidobacteriota bacterium]
MNRKYAWVLLAVLHFTAFSGMATTEELLSDVDRLVAEKKYLSAFKLLNTQEDGDSNPDIVLKKVDLALKYFGMSMNHRIFAFKDLEKDENIMDVRGKPGKFEMYPFDPEMVLTQLIEASPEDLRLHVSLADYYLEVYEKYRGRWEKSDEEVLKNAEAHYDEAVQMGRDLDGKIYFRAGKTALYRKDFPVAAERLEISVKKSSDYAPARYNLAYAYLFQNRPAEAAPHAVAAYEIYKEIPLKADAAMLAGQAFLESGKREEALKYFLLCDRIAPKKFENMCRLMGFYVQSGQSREAKAVGVRIFELDPAKPAMSQAILSTYADSPLEEELPGIFKELAGNYQDNSMAAGNAFYYLALFYQQTGKNDLAFKLLDKAEESFRKSLQEDHVVFKAIDQIRRNANQPANTKKE